MTEPKTNKLDIAIVGISAEFPGSPDYRSYWKNLCEGNELVKEFTKEELLKAGISEDQLNNPSFIPVEAVMEQREYFDHAFFEYRSEEASFMDPQIRVFHEHCWKALEDAGAVNDIDTKKIGLFAAAGDSLNWSVNAYLTGRTSSIDPFYLGMISSQRYISSLVSYKLNFRGPSFYMDTACSSSLFAVHKACQSLLLRECSVALAGGAKINTVKEKGYIHREGMIESSDGHCRAFDKHANGTVSGEGVGVVVLKRMADALKDGDHIYAVIKASAANNDGNNKVGYTAPGVEGQADCIRMAHKLAGIDPRSISYIETHGTATRLGDPIEVKALNEAFAVGGTEKYCAIGSVKTNMGHLDAAAGIAGLIKTALSLKNKKLAPSLHFSEPNPEIDFNDGPFYVNTKLHDWQRKENSPLRAGVSSFGIGGTNVHILMEEVQESTVASKIKKHNILVLSARTKAALLRQVEELKGRLSEIPSGSITDLAYTFQTGRKHFNNRFSLVYSDKSELEKLLSAPALKEQVQKSRNGSAAAVFMFSGAGSQYEQMGKDLYLNEPVFREEMDKGFTLLQTMTGRDYRSILYPSGKSSQQVNEMLHAQPMIFLFEYALARLLMNWGIMPKYMIGHSIGEYVAACLSGVFSYEDALRLVVKRGELMHRLPEGAMLSVALDEENARQYLSPSVSLAAVNAPAQIVLSGSAAAIDALKQELDLKGVLSVRLFATQAGHSHVIDQILEDYEQELDKVSFHIPNTSFISNVTGKFIAPEIAASKKYWLRHIRETVRFSEGIKTLLSLNEELVFIEAGGGHSLVSLTKQQQQEKKKRPAINLIRHPKEAENDERFLLKQLGQLWCNGIQIDWQSYYKDQKQKKISLPTYSFERIKYPVDISLSAADLMKGSQAGPSRINNPDDWFYRIQWKLSGRLPQDFSLVDTEKESVLLFVADHIISENIKKIFAEKNVKIIAVSIGEEFKKVHNDVYTINPADKNNYRLLFTDLKNEGAAFSRIIHLWNSDAVLGGDYHSPNISFYQMIGYESILEIVRAYSENFSSTPLRFDVVGKGWYSITGDELLSPERSTVLGALKVIPYEFDNISCRAIELADDSVSSIASLVNEFDYLSPETEIAIRGNARYIKGFERLKFVYPEEKIIFKKGGTYLVTGAKGGMAKVVAGYLAQKYKAKLVLLYREGDAPDNLQTLEQFGASVFCIQSEISNPKKIAKGIKAAEELFGKINGVIHTAGTADYAGVILRRSREDDAKIFAPKLFGTQLLYSLFKDKALDFFVNCSSKAATIVPFGQVGYAAANIYLDSFAEAKKAKFPVISIEWDYWRGVGMAQNAMDNLDPGSRENMTRNGMSQEEGIAVLERALYLDLPVQIISTRDLQQVIEQLLLHVSRLREGNMDTAKIVLHERPEDLEPFEAANTEMEKQMVLVWEGFFGIKPVGVNDSFFDLGGDSLKAMFVLKKLEKELGVTVSLKEFYTARTIRQLSEIADEQIWLRSKSEKKFSSVI